MDSHLARSVVLFLPRRTGTRSSRVSSACLIISSWETAGPAAPVSSTSREASSRILGALLDTASAIHVIGLTPSADSRKRCFTCLILPPAVSYTHLRAHET